MYKKPTIHINGREWVPTMITPDTEELSNAGDRMMLRFSRDANPEFFVAPKGTMYAGWVVGTNSA